MSEQKKLKVKKANLVGLKILAATIIMSQVGCGDIQKETANNQPVKNEKTNLVQAQGSARFQIQELDIPHQYQILISWPSEFKKVVIEDSGKRIFESESLAQYSHPVRDNTKFVLRVFSLDAEMPVLIGEYSGQTPRDFSIESSIELRQDLVIDASRVFLTNESKIQTNGFKIKVKADKFFSDGAEIFSFMPNSKAPVQTDGVSGGFVEIKAKEARGHLQVNLRGQNGGDGVDGQAWDIRAATGATGRSGAHECAKLNVGGIGIGGPLKCWCTRNPDNGGVGATGEKGRDGTKAGRGGNSGVLVVEIQEKTDFVVEPFQSNGLAGIPGSGSFGQKGGLGGAAGDATSSECSGANQGPEGQEGEKGADGERAADGVIEALCISIGQGEGKCQIKQ